MGSTYKGVYEPAVGETGWGTLVNANWTLLADREELVRKTADESVTSSAVLQNDNHLVYAMTANHTWAFRLIVSASHAAAAVGLRSSFTVPAAASWTCLLSTHSGSGTAFVTGGTADTANIPAAGRLAILEGIVTCGATPGNFQYQWCQTASNGTALVVAANSYLLMKLLV